MPPSASRPPIVIKRYARSRLYHAAERRYVSLDELRAWAERGLAFAVIDTETKEDVTAVLMA